MRRVRMKLEDAWKRDDDEEECEEEDDDEEEDDEKDMEDDKEEDDGEENQKVRKLQEVGKKGKAWGLEEGNLRRLEGSRRDNLLWGRLPLH